MRTKRKFLVVALAAVLAGALFLSVPGAAIQVQLGGGEGTPQTQPQPLQPWMRSLQPQSRPQPQPQPQTQTQAQEDPLPGLFLKALAKQLGITEEQLKQALMAAKDEVISERLERAVERGWLTRERAERLRQRLSQAGPRELARIMLKLKGLKEREMKGGFLLKPGFNRRRWQPQPRMEVEALPPYPPVYGYNCVCYCNFPPPSWNWEWPQFQPQPRWHWPQQPYGRPHHWFKPWPQPKSKPGE